MQITANETVGRLASEIAGATRLFQQLGINYCCGGERPLQEACASAGADLEQTLDALRRLSANPEPTEQADWNRAPLADLIAHIVNHHHRYTREQISLLPPLLEKVVSRRGPQHPNLMALPRLMDELQNDLSAHMMKEEKILFPYVQQLEAAAAGSAPPPRAMFGTVRNPIQMMISEHDDAAQIMEDFRRQTNNYDLPADACSSFQLLYQELEALERDLHQHIHLENNILFPRSLQLEAALVSGPAAV